jgi:hypothetical protein
MPGWDRPHCQTRLERAALALDFGIRRHAGRRSGGVCATLARKQSAKALNNAVFRCAAGAVRAILYGTASETLGAE